MMLKWWLFESGRSTINFGGIVKVIFKDLLISSLAEASLCEQTQRFHVAMVFRKCQADVVTFICKEEVNDTPPPHLTSK